MNERAGRGRSAICGLVDVLLDDVEQAELADLGADAGQGRVRSEGIEHAHLSR